MAERVAHVTSEASQTGQRPSIFDLLAQESLTSSFRPALRFLIKYLSTRFPDHLGSVHKWFEEIYTGLELIVESHFLKTCSASFSENFYGLKRVCSASGQLLDSSAIRLKSLIILVLVPYLRMKLDSLHNKLSEKLRTNGAQSGNKPSDRLFRAFLAIYPWVCSALDFWSLVLQLGYLVSKTNIHSPWLWLAGVRLQTLNADDLAPIFPSPPRPSGLLSALKWLLRLCVVGLTKTMGTALFFVQFLDWWYSSDRPEAFAKASQVVPPAPQQVLSEWQIVKMDPKKCPICKQNRRNDTVLAVSGYVYCYSCIFHHLKNEGCCPVTKLAAGMEHLIRIFPNETLPAN